MSNRFFRLRVVWAVAVTTLLACSVALADDNDPSVIEQQLSQLESDPAKKSLTTEPVASARKALERVKNAQAAGDAPHAIELLALARTYLTLATDLSRAAALESALAQVHKRTTELEQKRRSAEALLEETISHRERARAELQRLREEPATPPLPAQKPEAAKASIKPALGGSVSKAPSNKQAPVSRAPSPPPAASGSPKGAASPSAGKSKVSP